MGVVATWVEITQAARQQPTVYRALLHYSASRFHLDFCVGGRVGRGLQTVPGLYGMRDSLFIWYHPKELSNYHVIACDARSTLRIVDIVGDGWEDYVWFQL